MATVFESGDNDWKYFTWEFMNSSNTLVSHLSLPRIPTVHHRYAQ